MTPEQQAAYVIAMAENQQRNTGQAFTDLINRYGIHHNAVLTMFRNL